MSDTLLEEQRENWGSRTGFVLAAIGSAVGLGNLWGFPYKLYRYGGGAFLIPYICAMLVIGIPVLILEFSLGHMSQRAAPDAYRGIGRKKEPVGWWGIILGFVIITYYPVILAWCLSFFGRCIEGIIYYGGQLPWAGIGKEGVTSTKNFFLFEYCNMWTGSEGAKPWALGSFNPEIVFCLVAIWLLMFLCIFKGVRVVSKVVLWTVPLPWLMLLILAVNGLMQEGAVEGLAYYLNPDWSQLLKPTTWRFAFGQVFFSMSLAFGVMITYASFLHRKSDINNNAAIIGLGDLGTSFVAGIAVFATLGAMSVAAAVPVKDVVGEGTVGLAFMAFPYALAQLPYSAWFGLAFFVALLTLGIDSAFSITESVLAAIVDKTGWNRTAVLWGMSFVGLTAGLVYCSRGGLTWLDSIDGFINGPWGIALLGLVQCVVVGWMYRISRLRRHANERSDWKLGVWWDWNIRIVAPVILSALFAWSLYDTVTNKDGYLFSTDGALNVPTAVGLVLAGLAPVLAVLLSLAHSRGPSRFAESRAHAAIATPSGADILGAVIAMVAIGAAVAGGVLTGLAKLKANAGTEISGFFSHSLTMSAAYCLVGAMALAFLAIIRGSVAVIAAERRDMQPAFWARLAGAAGTMAFGAGGGMMLGLWVLVKNIEPGSVAHTTEMTPAAYIIMAIMLALLVVGLGWCFYRAIKAAGAATAEEEQLPESQ